MKKPSHSNNGRRRSHQQPRKPQQNRNANPSGQQNRQRSHNGSQNKQATEMWLKPVSDTLTSHIPMGNSKPGQSRDNSSSQNRRPGQNQSSNRPRQGQQQNRFGSRNSSGERQFKSRPFTPPTTKSNGNGSPNTPAPKAPPAATPAPTQANRGPLPEVDHDIPRPEGLKKLTADIEPFELFCAYHLGITQDRGYKPSNINEVARRFRVDPATIKQALKEYNMDPAALMDRDFDMALGQLDIQVAPEGVDRKELAKNIYQEYLESEIIKRDWDKILEEDRKENQKVFKD